MRNRRWIIYGKILGTAIVVVLLVRALLVTSCFLPSSGMENSLYKGEGVLVSKWSYGLRLPFPSLIGYYRLASTCASQGDIVLFNNPLPDHPNQRLEFRDIFISRCIGSPGDTLMLNNQLLTVDGEVFSPDSKELYVYSSFYEDELENSLISLGLSDNSLVGYASGGRYIRSFSHYEYYLVSQRVGEKIQFTPLAELSMPTVSCSEEKCSDQSDTTSCHFFSSDTIKQKIKGARPFVIPAQGKMIKVYPWNVRLLCNTLITHEHRRAKVKGDTLLLDDKPVSEVIFTKDYYWMASNDPANFNDSRLFGFVPHDHLIGKAWRIWYPARKGRFFQRVH